MKTCTHTRTHTHTQQSKVDELSEEQKRELVDANPHTSDLNAF